MLDEIIKNIIEETVVVTIQKMMVSNINKSQVPEVMNVKQLAEYMGMSVQWVYEHTKEIPHEKRGRKTIFIRKEIDDWRQLQRENKEYNCKVKLVPSLTRRDKAIRRQ